MSKNVDEMTSKGTNITEKEALKVLNGKYDIKKKKSFWRKLSKKQKKGLIICCSSIVVAIVIFILGFSLANNLNVNKEEIVTDAKQEVFSESTLYNLVQVSKLSTYQCVYNDVCTVSSEDADEDDFYCAYEATVKAGIDFSKIRFEITQSSADENQRTITAYIPKATIGENDIDVEITTLDYMFVNSSANKSGVSERAYRQCVADVKKKSANESQIFELAQENAENTIRALIKPFVEQTWNTDITYEINVEVLEDSDNEN